MIFSRHKLLYYMGDTMRYLGSKYKLLSSIEEVIIQNNISGTTFADLFSGTGCVGDHFKGKYQIISNDFLYYSYILSHARLNNTSVPSFDCFYQKYNSDIFDWLNGLQFIPNNMYFFYNNYTPKGNRMFFTEKNGIKIDGIRLKIEELYKEQSISENEYNFLIASMIESVTKISNTSGTYEAFLKFWDARAEKDFELTPLEINEEELFSDNLIYNEDTNELVRKIQGDIAYIDPPYTVTQYVSAYHIFETLSKYDSPVITGIGGKRGREGKNSLYAQKTKAKTAFEDLFRQINFKHILISYSNQGLVSIEELCELASHFAVNGHVKINQYDYREYQNHRSSNKRNGNNLNEVIIYFEKDLKINKSPLNYSGSKDTLLPSILKALPSHIGTFVDVMGGAFNVGANVTALEKVVYNEINPYIYEIIQWLITNDKHEIIENVESIIKQYKLNKKAKEPYEQLRTDYNNSKSSDKLYVLHMYAFQNMIRFNSNHQFNTPIGVAGYSEDIKDRINNFSVKAPLYELTNSDYISIDWNSYPQDTVFYFDPPYYITNATYNDGKRGLKGWGINEEVEMLNIIKHLDELGYKFILSNVLEHNNRTNDLLMQWVKENNYSIINVGSSGWRYKKNEILVINY